jgi:hypothetical protein
MAIGSCVHLRDTLGGQIPGTSFSRFTLGSTITLEGAAYANGVTYLEFSESGDFLVSWSFHYDDTSNGRANYQTKAVITVGSGALWTTWRSGYNRNSANPKAWSNGIAWYRATAGDRMEIHHRRDTDTPTGGSVANRSNVTGVRMWAPLAYGIYEDITNTSRAQGTTPVSMTFDDVILENDTSVIEKTSSSRFSLKKNTNYLVGYAISGDQYTSSSFRTQRVSQLHVGGTAFICGDSYCFQRNSANEYAGLSALAIVTVTSAPTELRVQVWQGDGTDPLSPASPANNVGGCDVPAAWERVPGEGGLLIAEIPSWVHAFHCHDDPIAGQDISGGTTDLNVARNVPHISPSWQKVDNQTIKALNAMPALLFGNVRTARTDVSSALRGQFNGRIRKNAGALTAGDSGNYSRGLEGGAGSTYGGGFNPCVVACGTSALVVDDVVGIRTTIDGEAGDDGTLKASLSGMNISTFAGVLPGTGGPCDRKLKVATGGLVQGRIATSGG